MELKMYWQITIAAFPQIISDSLLLVVWYLITPLHHFGSLWGVTGVYSIWLLWALYFHTFITSLALHTIKLTPWYFVYFTKQQTKF